MALCQAWTEFPEGPPQLQLMTPANSAAYRSAKPTEASDAKVRPSSATILTGSILQEYAAPAVPKLLFAIAPAIPAQHVPCAANELVPGFGSLSPAPNPA